MKQRQAKDFGVPSAAGLGGLGDEEAQALAEKVVREVRRELAKELVGDELPKEKAPAPEEVRRRIAAEQRKRRGISGDV